MGRDSNFRLQVYERILTTDCSVCTKDYQPADRGGIESQKCTSPDKTFRCYVTPTTELRTAKS